jgi:hypothetical protein
MGGTTPWWADEIGWSCCIWQKNIFLKKKVEVKGGLGRGERRAPTSSHNGSLTTRRRRRRKKTYLSYIQETVDTYKN